LFKQPYRTVLKPYGDALVAQARKRPNLLCIGADLTRQTETDLFRDQIPDRFINVGMAEANMIGIAGGLARAGHLVFVNTFGVFCTRRCFDQIAMAIAYPALNVKIVGFMPGLSSPGGPSHQAIEDIALMRSLPNLTVVEPADALETRLAVAALANHLGPVYMRLKRGEIPAIFEEGHAFSLECAQIHLGGESADACLFASGMMLPAALSAADALKGAGIQTTVVNVPVIKPLDTNTVVKCARGARAVITAENHSVIGGLGSAVAECLSTEGLGVPLRRVGIADKFGESGSREFLFAKYGLDTQTLIDSVWDALGMRSAAPRAAVTESAPGEYAPV
jgi:transketolase